MSQGFKLKNGSYLVVVESPGGIYNAPQLDLITTFARQESSIIKILEDQRVALFVKEDRLSTLKGQLKQVGLDTRPYREGLHQPLSCVGALCPDFQQDALDASIKITDILGGFATQSPFKIGINGCQRCCVPTHTLDISVVGEESGYRISLGGKTSQFPELANFMAESVPAAELPSLVKKVLEVYSDLAEAQESLQDVMDRCGSRAFVDALKPYSMDAATDDSDAIESGVIGVADAPMNASYEEEAASEDMVIGDDVVGGDADIDPKGHLEAADQLGAMDDLSPKEHFEASAPVEDVIVGDKEEASFDMEETGSEEEPVMETIEEEPVLEEASVIVEDEAPAEMGILESEPIEEDEEEEPASIQEDLPTEETNFVAEEEGEEEEPSAIPAISGEDLKEEEEATLETTAGNLSVGGDVEVEMEEEETKAPVEETTFDIQEEEEEEVVSMESKGEDDLESEIEKEIDVTESMQDDENESDREMVLQTASEPEEEVEVPAKQSRLTAKMSNGLSKKGWHVSGVNLSDEGHLIVSFDGGGSVEVSLDHLEEEDLKVFDVCGNKIQVVISEGYLEVALEQFKFSFPWQESSAA